MKWEVWHQTRVGEANVALWGQSDCPVARCESDRKEQWDITHPENTVQRVRGEPWLRLRLSVALSVFDWFIHAWTEVAAPVEDGVGQIYVLVKTWVCHYCGERRSVNNATSGSAKAPQADKAALTLTSGPAGLQAPRDSKIRHVIQRLQVFVSEWGGIINVVNRFRKLKKKKSKAFPSLLSGCPREKL